MLPMEMVLPMVPTLLRQFKRRELVIGARTFTLILLNTHLTFGVEAHSQDIPISLQHDDYDTNQEEHLHLP